MSFAGRPPVSNSRPPRVARPATLRLATVIAAVAALIGLSSYLRIRARAEAEVAQGEWELQLDRVPAWFPDDFRGELVRLTEIPRSVSLRSSNWHQNLRERLEANPWVERITDLRRDDNGVRFRADFVRPVVGVQVRGGFLLCDSAGRAIDVQPGAGLDSRWKVPAYRPEGGLREPPAGGTPVAAGLLAEWEARELFGLLDVLWGAGIYERWADALVRLSTRVTAEGDCLWNLEANRGPRIDWGRAPGSDRVPELPVERKLEHLRRTLRFLDELSEVPEVRLWEAAGPLVGVDAGRP